MGTILGIIFISIFGIGTILILTNPSVMRAMSFGHGGGGPGSHVGVMLRNRTSAHCCVVGYGKHDSYAVLTPNKKLAFTRYEQGLWREVTDEIDKLDHWLGRPWPYDPKTHKV